MKCPPITIVGLLSLSLSASAQQGCRAFEGLSADIFRQQTGFTWQGFARDLSVDYDITDQNGALRGRYRYEGPVEGSPANLQSFIVDSAGSQGPTEFWCGNSDGTWSWNLPDTDDCELRLASDAQGCFYRGQKCDWGSVQNNFDLICEGVCVTCSN